jgi:thiamine pyrophosphate-dependent acetolactate synthase large subunit-like protein
MTRARTEQKLVATKTALHLYELVADELVRAGVSDIFGLMGEDTAPVVVAADRRDVRYYAARHENQAVAMADGYWRVSRRVGVATVTGGPGFTNALTAINTARRAHSGVVVLTGGGRPQEDDHDTGAIRAGTSRSWLKFFPQAAVCRAMGLEVVTPATPEAAIHDLRGALARAARGEVVVVVITRDLLLAEAEPVDVQQTDPSPFLRTRPDPEDISVIVDLFQETWAVSRPVILAGRGAVHAGAGPVLRRLAELTGAVLATTLPARGLFHGDPYNIGVCGTFATPIAADVVTSANCVLAFGAGMNQYTTYENTLFPTALVVQVDVNEEAIGRFLDVEASIVADARLTAEALVAELEQRGHVATGLRIPELRGELETFDPADGFQDASTDDRIDPRTLMVELDRILPENRIIASDAGRHAKFAIRYLRVLRPENFAWIVDAGSIGLGLGAAVGAAVARPGELVVVPIGDAGLMMALGDLETAVRYQLPLVLIVANDEALGSEVNVLAAMGMPTAAAEISAPSFAEVARSLGADGMTVRTRADIAAVGAALARPRDVPLVVDCLIDRNAAGAA